MSHPASPLRPVPMFRRLPRAIREQQMLDAAVAVFSRRGYHDANVDDIAEVAGISKPMVYAYLGTKEELFTACLHREGTKLIEAIAATAGGDRPPDEQLWQGLRAFFAFVAEHRDGWTVLYRQARAQEPFAELLDQMRARMVDVVSGVLIDGPPGPLPTDPRMLGYAVVGAAEAVADWIVERPNCDPDTMATQLMNAIWIGTGALLRGESWRPPRRR